MIGVPFLLTVYKINKFIDKLRSDLNTYFQLMTRRQYYNIPSKKKQTVIPGTFYIKNKKLTKNEPKIEDLITSK